MTDYATVERIARLLAENAGRDYDRRGAKREHWRKKAQRVIAYCDSNIVLMRLYGWLA